jgi:hypothetical protein
VRRSLSSIRFSIKLAVATSLMPGANLVGRALKTVSLLVVVTKLGDHLVCTENIFVVISKPLIPAISPIERIVVPPILRARRRSYPSSRKPESPAHRAANGNRESDDRVRASENSSSSDKGRTRQQAIAVSCLKFPRPHLH